MNYIIGLLIAMAVVICLISFPVPSLIALALVGIWWVVVARKRWH